MNLKKQKLFADENIERRHVDKDLWETLPKIVFDHL